jgi:hypothetical protein
MDAAVSDPLSGRAPSAAAALSAAPAPDKPSGPSMIDKMIGSIGSGAAEARKRTDALDAEAMKLTPPEMKLPPKPEPKSTDPIDAWGSIAMVFAALASTRTRNHASTAMNAAASALNAIKQSDKTAYDQAFETWKVETQNAIELAHFQQDAYKTLLASVEHKENVAIEEGRMFDAATEAKLRVLTNSLGDPGMWRAYEQGGIAGAADFQKTRQKQAEEFELQKLKMNKAGIEQQKLMLTQQIMTSDAYRQAKTPRERLELLAPVDPERIETELTKIDDKDKIESGKLDAKVREAFDKNALGRAALEERVENDKAKQEFNKYKLGETEKEHEERTGLMREKMEVSKQSDEQRKFEFREKMDLQLKQFDERKQVDEQRLAQAKERMEHVEKTASARSQPLTPEQIEENAKLMAHLKMPMATNTLTSRNNTWEQANLRAVEIAKKEGRPDFSEQWYPALQRQRIDAATGAGAKGIRSLSVADKHLEAMEAAILALPNDAGVKPLTRAFNFIANQVNDSNLSGEQIDAKIVSNEVAKAISASGNMTGAEREDLESMFDANRGKESLIGIIHHARELLGGQVAGYMRQFSKYAPAADVTNLDDQTAKSFFVDPNTGEISSKLVQWDVERGKAVLEGKLAPPMPDLGGALPAPPAPQAAPSGQHTPEQTAGTAPIANDASGKPVFWRDGKFVYGDGSPYASGP